MLLSSMHLAQSVTFLEFADGCCVDCATNIVVVPEINAEELYIGCYKDQSTARALPYNRADMVGLTPEKCIEHCREKVSQHAI